MSKKSAPAIYHRDYARDSVDGRFQPTKESRKVSPKGKGTGIDRTAASSYAEVMKVAKKD